jgi:cobalamin biosynthesis protein CobW
MRRIPATIVTGFLGAGKTSLVRHLLAHADGRRLAIIVNEFGELGIDRELLIGCGDASCAEEDVVELANGCICCTVADDFLPALTALVERPNPPDHIVVETSGLALPKPLVQALAWPEIRTRTTVDGVVTVIDAAALAAGLFAADPEALARQRAADPPISWPAPTWSS